MEPKKLKKLDLNKESISNLSDNSLSQVKGGTDWFGSNTGCVSCIIYNCGPPPGGGGGTPSAVVAGGVCYTNDYEICRTH